MRKYPTPRQFGRAFIATFVAITATCALILASCAADTTGEEQLSVPSAFTMEVEGYTLQCVSIIGYSNYGGGVSCDWESWREAKDGGY